MFQVDFTLIFHLLFSGFYNIRHSLAKSKFGRLKLGYVADQSSSRESGEKIEQGILTYSLIHKH